MFTLIPCHHWSRLDQAYMHVCNHAHISSSAVASVSGPKVAFFGANIWSKFLVSSDFCREHEIFKRNAKHCALVDPQVGSISGPNTLSNHVVQLCCPIMLRNIFGSDLDPTLDQILTQLFGQYWVIFLVFFTEATICTVCIICQKMF